MRSPGVCKTRREKGIKTTKSIFKGKGDIDEDGQRAYLCRTVGVTGPAVALTGRSFWTVHVLAVGRGVANLGAGDVLFDAFETAWTDH